MPPRWVLQVDLTLFLLWVIVSRHPNYTARALFLVFGLTIGASFVTGGFGWVGRFWAQLATNREAASLGALGVVLVLGLWADRRYPGGG